MKISIIPSNIFFKSDGSETILEAALNAGFTLAHSCKNGDCGLCESTLIYGVVVNKQGQEFIAEDKILTCCCSAKDDIVLQANYYPELAGIKTRTVPCKVDSYQIVNDNIMILRLRLPPTAKLNYLSGQYVNLSYQGVVRSYSIANATDGYLGVELHIKHVSDGKMSGLLFQELKEGTLMRLEGPCGTFFIRNSSNPIIFLAGGTGFAPVQAMVEQLIKSSNPRQIYIYWGMDKSTDFYSTAPKQWADSYDYVSFTPVVSGVDEQWQGRRGLVHHAVMDDFDSLTGIDIYACGSSLMIEAAKRDFLSKELIAENFYSDVFTAAK